MAIHMLQICPVEVNMNNNTLTYQNYKSKILTGMDIYKSIVM